MLVIQFQVQAQLQAQLLALAHLLHLALWLVTAAMQILVSPRLPANPTTVQPTLGARRPRKIVECAAVFGAQTIRRPLLLQVVVPGVHWMHASTYVQVTTPMSSKLASSLVDKGASLLSYESY